MIVRNPPAIRSGVKLLTARAEEQAVEAAIILAGLRYCCAETAGPTKWLRTLEGLGEDATFAVEFPSGLMPIKVLAEADANASDRQYQMVVDGAEGVLHVASLLALWRDAERSPASAGAAR